MIGDGTNTYGYDGNGNLSSTNSSPTHIWDRANRLLSFGGASNIYDGEGRRVQQSVSSTVTKYLLDIQPGLAVVLSQDVGSDVTRFVHAPRGIHARKDNADAWHWTVQDGLGTVRVETNNSVSVEGAQNFDPYGNLIGIVNGAIGTPYGFTGEQTDDNGQIYLRARYYNPSIGLFPSLDPFEGDSTDCTSLNGYNYVGGNTINKVDPSGSVPVWGGLLIANVLNGFICSQSSDCPIISQLLGLCSPPTTPTPTPTPTPVSGAALYDLITTETKTFFSDSTELDCLTRAVQNEVGAVGSGITQQARLVTWAILNRRSATRELDYQAHPNGGGNCGSNGQYAICKADCRPIDVNSEVKNVVKQTVDAFKYRSLSADPTYGGAGWRQNPNRPYLKPGETLTGVWPQIADTSRCGDFFCRKRSTYFPKDLIVAPCEGSDYVETAAAFYDRVKNRQDGLNLFYGTTRISTGFNMTRDEAINFLGGCVERVYVTTVNTCDAGTDGDNICQATHNKVFAP
ncbi:MAG: RHS repeat-associated core domain-containing protein [Chloroflexota bacterium]